MISKLVSMLIGLLFYRSPPLKFSPDEIADFEKSTRMLYSITLKSPIQANIPNIGSFNTFPYPNRSSYMDQIIRKL